MTYNFYSDPRHGWLKVPRSKIKQLGIEISKFSYQKGDWVYLEEDLDLDTFVDAARVAGEIVKFKELPSAEKSSRIRNYQSYQGEQSK